MKFISEDLSQYAQDHTTKESDLLNKINRETYMQVLYPVMLSGQLQGQFLKMISHIKRPKYILEIGTFTGYATLCLAEGLQKDGKLYTIDINEELESRVKGYFKESGHGDHIELMIGDALTLLPTLDVVFDLVFLDADKINYLKYYNLIFDKIALNGIILADNVLWSGKVVDKKAEDEDTQALIHFNKTIQEDSRVENVLLPVRDGIMMVRKISD